MPSILLLNKYYKRHIIPINNQMILIFRSLSLTKTSNCVTVIHNSTLLCLEYDLFLTHLKAMLKTGQDN